jgi:hypothetical protein
LPNNRPNAGALSAARVFEIVRFETSPNFKTPVDALFFHLSLVAAGGRGRYF